jgi:hypothetical protein
VLIFNPTIIDRHTKLILYTPFHHFSVFIHVREIVTDWYFILLFLIKGCLDANRANRIWVSTHIATMTMMPFMNPDEGLQVLDSSYIPECGAKVMTETLSESRPSYVYIFRGTKDYRTNSLE